MATKFSFNTRGVEVKPVVKPAITQVKTTDRPVSVKTTEVKPTEA